MTTVTGTLRDPVGNLATGKVRFHLGGANGEQVRNAFVGNQSLVRSHTVDLVAGAYSVVLDGNDLITPAGTRWIRTFDQGAQALLVPATGTVSEEDILADPPASIESAALSQHAASTTLHGGGRLLARVAKSDGDFTTSSTTPVLITGMQLPVLIPARPFAVRFRAQLEASASGAELNLRIVTTADGTQQSAPWEQRSVAAVQRFGCLWEADFPHGATGGTPTAGTTVTYEPRIMVSTGSVTVKAQHPFGVNSEAVIEAVTL